MLRGFVITIFYLVSLAVILFVSAGRIDWLMGWTALVVYSVISLLAVFLADPELVRERSSIRSGTKARDAILATVSFLFFFPLTLLVAGLDVGRFAWSPSFLVPIQLVALVVFALGNALGLWAVVSNKYFSTFVRIQDDRSHEVVTQGPYRYMRHPGYAGSMLAAIALPIALGSLWAIIPACIGAAGFAFRTALEDRTLLQELDGYREYASTVHYRLIPGVW